MFSEKEVLEGGGVQTQKLQNKMQFIVIGLQNVRGKSTKDEFKELGKGQRIKDLVSCVSRCSHHPDEIMVA